MTKEQLEIISTSENKNWIFFSRSISLANKYEKNSFIYNYFSPRLSSTSIHSQQTRSNSLSATLIGTDSAGSWSRVESNANNFLQTIPWNFFQRVILEIQAFIDYCTKATRIEFVRLVYSFILKSIYSPHFECFREKVGFECRLRELGE